MASAGRHPAARFERFLVRRGGGWCAQGPERGVSEKHDGKTEGHPQEIGMTLGEGAGIGIVGGQLFTPYGRMQHHFVRLDMKCSCKVILRRGCPSVSIDQPIGTAWLGMEEHK